MKQIPNFLLYCCSVTKLCLTRLLYSPLTLGVCSNSRPLSQSYYLTISSTNSQRNAKQNHHEISSHIHQNGCVHAHSVVSYSLQPYGLQLARLLCSWDFPGKNTEVGCHFLLQGTFLTQGLNPHLLLDRWILYH